MENYRDFLPELKSTTLFQNIEDEALIALLEKMQPAINIKKADDPNPPKMDFEHGMFSVVLRGVALDQLAPRPDKYNMPKFGEPGMMMGEIPCLSEMFRNGRPPMPPGGPKGKHGGPPFGGPQCKHGGRPKPPDFDIYTLQMSGEMITKDYGPDVAEAQSTMLRNFLGILAQKVTDVRKEKGKIAGELAELQDRHSLHIFSAGCMMKPMKETIERWNELHPELPAVMQPGGSVDLVRQVQNGELCDVLVSADDTIIDSMLLPEYADGYYAFAGNKMVIAGPGINSENWQEKLLAPDAIFMHMNPYGDPGGYRAVMALLLADNVQPGLSDKLMNHPGHKGMEKREEHQPGGPAQCSHHSHCHGPGQDEQICYKFGYYSGAASRGNDFAELPAVMDLSDESLADVYAKVAFAVDDNNTVTAAPISHAVTIPKAAKHPEAAREFVRMFLENDFAAMHFLPRNKKVGDWTI